MTPTDQYIRTLESLKPGDLGKLRNFACLSLEESAVAFDLFAGLWWPLREKNQKSPRREVAWLIAKLYAFHPMPQSAGAFLPLLLSRVYPDKDNESQRYQQMFDNLLSLPLSQIELPLQWALSIIVAKNEGLDWVQLTDDLSIWERESTRLKWAKQYLYRVS